MRVTITEDKFNHLLLNEARMEGFRVDTLREQPSYAAKVRYCKEMLGEPIGNGSSRMVFQLDDETVLKLAKNDKGIAQNEQEHDLYRWGASEYLPKVYNGSDEEDFLWIVSEYVLPSKVSDFKKAVSVPFKDVQRLVFSMICRNFNVANEIFSKYEDNYEAIEFLNAIQDLHYSYNMELADMAYTRNWGMVMRDGKPMMVLLDSGLSKEVFDKHYKRW